MMPNTKHMVEMYKEHHQRVFDKHGETPKGVDWGDRRHDHILRLDRMLSVAQTFPCNATQFSLLDVGCGYGSLYDRALELEVPIEYTGIELVDDMLTHVRTDKPEANWITGDVLTHTFVDPFDYVITNGTLTQKLELTIPEMEEYSKTMIKRMFSLCRKGVAFNLMSSHVNFMVPNLYYTNPLEVIAWCMSEVSPKIRVDHAYPLFEYTVYLYR
ncbi:MAG: class I SAM-dependent methyltransferase [Dokdonella sp.]|uniref:class I SAM-dependent methyltransferase n=1 Tax=Dokdonella sp. TaxID=2291710 RepID=UPI0025C6A35E|nr:class I SAM-dependent methyltransferase [Dokdonella sp.]MBZ0224284.1 class I SAM-dependent methyltransferase [Dokdonella sp.]